jgi:Uma2 family endonuclease
MVTVEETYLPVTLFAPGMTDAKFKEFCELYSDYRLEYTAEGELIIMPPTDPETGARNARLTSQLDQWAERDGRGFVVDSSGGFTLRNGARLSPDSSWISVERYSREECPEFVTELLSPADRLNKLHAKMLEWLENGVALGWLINPTDKTVIVYRPGREPETFTGVSSLAGEGPVAGFELDLERIWTIRPKSR